MQRYFKCTKQILRRGWPLGTDKLTSFWTTLARIGYRYISLMEYIVSEAKAVCTRWLIVRFNWWVTVVLTLSKLISCYGGFPPNKHRTRTLSVYENDCFCICLDTYPNHCFNFDKWLVGSSVYTSKKAPGPKSFYLYDISPGWTVGSLRPSSICSQDLSSTYHAGWYIWLFILLTKENRIPIFLNRPS